MSIGLAIVFLVGVALGGWAWWKLFNTPNGERYLKMRSQGPFVPLSQTDEEPPR
jgi:hypothetical protein